MERQGKVVRGERVLHRDGRQRVPAGGVLEFGRVGHVGRGAVLRGLGHSACVHAIKQYKQ